MSARFVNIYKMKHTDYLEPVALFMCQSYDKLEYPIFYGLKELDTLINDRTRAPILDNIENLSAILERLTVVTALTQAEIAKLPDSAPYENWPRSRMADFIEDQPFAKPITFATEDIMVELLRNSVREPMATDLKAIDGLLENDIMVPVIELGPTFTTQSSIFSMPDFIKRRDRGPQL